MEPNVKYFVFCFFMAKGNKWREFLIVFIGMRYVKSQVLWQTVIRGSNGVVLTLF